MLNHTIQVMGTRRSFLFVRSQASLEFIALRVQVVFEELLGVLVFPKEGVVDAVLPFLEDHLRNILLLGHLGSQLTVLLAKSHQIAESLPYFTLDENFNADVGLVHFHQVIL